jgi:AbiA family abortive infection protein
MRRSTFVKVKVIESELITYKIWEQTCSMMFSVSNNKLNKFLQWYPFSIMKTSEKEKIISEEFFNKVIKNGRCFLYPQMYFKTSNYLQKLDGSFRNSTLISPLAYLILQSFGNVIHKYYVSRRPDNSYCYYAGNYYSNDIGYKKEYSNFTKKVNYFSLRCNYFMKTDISSFYDSISLDKLFFKINQVVNKESVKISHKELFLAKNWLNYMGNGHFPLVENSIASSFLSTVIYLEEIDNDFQEFLSNSNACSEIHDIQTIRYVDDQYILFNSELSLNELKNTKNEMINMYSSILNKKGLNINSGKTAFKKTEDIDDELKKSLYDDDNVELESKIGELSKNCVYSFIERLHSDYRDKSITSYDYREIVNDEFRIDELHFSPIEVFHYWIYKRPDFFKNNKRLIKVLKKIISEQFNVISFDPKRLCVVIKNTKDNIIKNLLNSLFKYNSNGIWNSYHTVVLVQYLIQTGFHHNDLISKILCRRCKSLFHYYEEYCKTQRGSAILNINLEDKPDSIFVDDVILCILYSNFVFEYSNGNIYSAYAYYISYFDRISTWFKFIKNNKHGFPNEWLKRSKKLNGVYRYLDCKNIIERSHQLRNNNPLIHASSELLIDEPQSPKAKEAYTNGIGGIIHVNICEDDICSNIKSNYNFNVDDYLIKDFNKSIDNIFHNITADNPLIDFVADDGVRHEFWVVSDNSQ